MGQLMAPGIPRICPICRKKFRSGQELKIHIELSDPSDAASSIAVDQINSLTKDSSSEAAQKTAQELERMVFQQAEDLDEDKAVGVSTVEILPPSDTPKGDYCAGHQ